MATVQVTRNEVIDILKNVEKNTFIYVVMETIVRMNKKNNPYHNQVTKRTRGTYGFGNSYEDRVNSNARKEGLETNFTAESSRIGEHIAKCVLFNEKTQSHYLQLERYENLAPIETEYLFEGNAIDRMLFEDFLVKSSQSSRQQQDKKVMVISPKIENILEISLNGTKYILQD